MTRRACIRLLILSAAFVTGCAGHQHTSPSGLPVVQMTIGSKQYWLEVATTFGQREHGLMERDSLPADQGMLFVFDEEQPRTFWMKNTRIPLDIVYADHAGRVVATATMKPYDLSPVPSNDPAEYAIELNAGQLAACGIAAGQTVQLPRLTAASR